MLLSGLRLEQQKYAEAEPLLHAALANYEKTRPTAWQRYDTQSMLGAVLAGQREYAKAERLFLAGYRGLLERQATIPADSRASVLQAGERIVQLYHDGDKPNQAAQWRKEINAARLPSTPLK
jgi:hypothetical protein